MPSHACDRCHRRKVRCDRIVPRCSPCRRSNVDCQYAESEHQLRRRNVQKLERRIRDLEARNEALASHLDGSRSQHDGHMNNEGALHITDPQSPRPIPVAAESQHNGGQEVAQEVIQMSLIAGGGHNFVGSTSGLLLANLLQPRPHPESTTLLSNTVRRESSASGRHLPKGASGLPPKGLAEDLLRAYCSHDHLAYPFLSAKRLHQSLQAVYSATSQETADAVDAFSVDMTLAIATAQVHKFNWGGVYNAETHCNRAMTRLGDVLARDGIERIQALLLICQYRMGTTSSDTSTSVWHLIGVAARTCLEMGLHRASTYALPRGVDGTEKASHTEEMEIRKRCFWSLVALDRVTSLALGRPLAVQLEDIDVDFPDQGNSVGRDALPQESPLSSASYGTPQWCAATSIFVHIVKYRVLCGKVLNALHRSPKHTASNAAHASPEDVRESLARELREWHAQTDALQLVRGGAEAASPAESSSFRCEEWYQLLFHNGMLMLFRPSPALSDAASNSAALQRIHDSAREAVRLYASLHRSKRLNYSWVTMQHVFIAGLSYIYALRNHLQSVQIPAGQGEATPRSRLHTTPTVTQVVNATRDCSRVLVAVSERWDLARNCSDLFDRLSDAVIADILEARTGSSVTPAAQHATPQTPLPIQNPGNMPMTSFTSDGFGQPGFMGMTVDSTFRDCFGDLQNLGLDAFHNDALAQLSQGWYLGIEGEPTEFF